MPFDPALPRNNTKIVAAEVRGQLNGLKEIIDALPAPIPGPAGRDGNNGADGATGAPGIGIANVYDCGDGTGRVIVALTDGNSYGPFTIGTGPQGLPGATGNDGRGIASVSDDGMGRAVITLSDGTQCGPFTIATGPQGEQGNEGPPGKFIDCYRGEFEISTIYNRGDVVTCAGGCYVSLADGNSYNDPRSGTVWALVAAPGQPGPTGEVSAQQLSDAVAGTSANTNAIELLDLTISDPPTQSEVQAVMGKLNELITALRR